MANTGFMLGSRDQLMKNPAIPSEMAFAATASQRSKLPLQSPHALQTGLDTSQLRIDQLVDIAAVAFWMRHKCQQALDVCQRNIQSTAMADKSQPFHMQRGIGCLLYTSDAADE